MQKKMKKLKYLSLCLLVLSLGTAVYTISELNNIPLTLILIFITVLSTILYSGNTSEEKTLKVLTETVKEMQNSCNNLRHLNSESSVFFDLSMAINQMARDFQDLKVKTARNERARKQLITNISHDIRTPLTSISGYIEALRDGITESPEEEQEYLQILSDKSAKLIKVVNSIFELAKLEAGDTSLKPVKLDLNETIRDSVVDFIPVFRSRNIEFINQLSSEPLTIYADLLSLQRILKNLIDNALTHGATGEVVGISTSRTETHICCTVWDRGPGIPAELRDTIFNRLYTSSKRAGNSGLGLEISKELAKQNNATLSVESEADKKTAFTIHFPVPGKDLIKM